MLFSTASISDLLYNSYRMFDIAATDPDIHNALLAINFTDQKLDALKATWNAANTATEDHKKAVENQKTAKLQFQTTLRESNANYMTHLKYARCICHDDQERWTKLGLGLPRKRKLNDMLLQASVFYSNILEDDTLVTTFDERYGETVDDIVAGRQAMANVNTSKETYITAIGNSQAKRADRDKLLRQLDRETTGFYAVLRKSLKDNLQHLEKVKIRVYSDGYKKKPPEEPPTEEPPTDPPTGTDPQTTDPNPGQ